MDAPTVARTPQAVIGENEPLIWLVSVFFSNEFWDRHGLSTGFYKFEVEDISDDVFTALRNAYSQDAARYPSLDDVYKAAEAFVRNTPEAKACLEKAEAAIVAGILSYYSPPPDKWGEVPYHLPGHINTYQFLEWMVRNGYKMTKAIEKAFATTIYNTHMRRQLLEQEAQAYPKITAEDFARLRKEPLWVLDTALLYLMGRRSRVKEKEAGFKGDGGLYAQMVIYATDAINAKTLPVVAAKTDDKLKVIPNDMIVWAETLPVMLPMLTSPAPAPIPSLTPLPAPSTPEMRLMFEAMEHFWAGDAAKSPPMKKIVTGWLQENASRFGIEALSDNLADAMDTLMRPAEARRGGLKAPKS